MTTNTTLTISEFAARYDRIVEAKCVDGLYEITGQAVHNSNYIEALCPEATVTVESEQLLGWGDYDRFVVVDFGGGFRGGYFAQLRSK